MVFEVTVQFLTSASREVVYDAVVKKFDLIANVYREGNYITADDIDTQSYVVRSKYRTDSTRISIRKKDHICDVDASVEYKPSAFFWISSVIGLIAAGAIYSNFRHFLDPYMYERYFTTVVWMYVGIILCVVVGCVIPVIFYVQQQNEIRTAIETAFQKVKAEFVHQSSVIESPSPNPLPLNAQTGMTNLATGYSTTVPQSQLGSASLQHPVSTSYVARDNTLERVRANGYWTQRAIATKMTIIGYFQFVVSGVMVLIGIIVLFIDFGALNMNLWSGYAVSLLCFIIAYRMLINGFTTFLQRDELLMRIDVAMNTALMATQITTLTQYMTAQKNNEKST